MTNTINKVELIGYVGENIKIGTFPNGDKYINTSIATHEYLQNQDQSEPPNQYTTWHRVTFKNKTAADAEKILTKGTLVQIKGKSKNRKYQDEDGKDKWINEVIAYEIALVPTHQS